MHVGQNKELPSFHLLSHSQWKFWEPQGNLVFHSDFGYLPQPLKEYSRINNIRDTSVLKLSPKNSGRMPEEDQGDRIKKESGQSRRKAKARTEYVRCSVWEIWSIVAILSLTQKKGPTFWSWHATIDCQSRFRFWIFTNNLCWSSRNLQANTSQRFYESCTGGEPKWFSKLKVYVENMHHSIFNFDWNKCRQEQLQSTGIAGCPSEK